MKKNLDLMLDFLNEYSPVKDQDRKLIEKLNRIKKYPRKTIVKNYSDTEQFSYFVLEGIVYSSFCEMGKDSIGDFYFPGTPILIPPVENLIENFEYQIIAISDCSLAVSNIQDVEAAMFANSRFEKVCRLVGEEVLGKKLRFFSKIRSFNAVERYRYILIHRPELVREVPNYLLANFLGISAETLSRIKNN